MNIISSTLSKLFVLGKIIIALLATPLVYGYAVIRKISISDTKLVDAPMQSGNNQPPDLDEVFEQWKRKLDKLFGDFNKGGNNSDGGSNNNMNIPSMNFLKSIIGVVALVIITITWLISGFYSVDADERGVVMQFGKYIKTTEPGWNWRIPYPFQSHEIVLYSRVRTFEITGSNSQSGAQMLTSDENVIQVQFTVQYDVVDPYNYVFVDVNPEATARLIAETAMREVVGNSTMDRVLSENREEVASNVKEIMQLILDRYKVGVRVQRVNLQSVNPPKAVQEAFDDVIKARQDQDRQINEGQAYQQDVVPRARGSASRLFEEAEGYKLEVIARAEGEASRFIQLYNQYKVAKDVTRERMYLDAVGNILSKSQKLIVDPDIKGIINFGDIANKSGSKIIPFYEEVKTITNNKALPKTSGSSALNLLQKRRTR